MSIQHQDIITNSQDNKTLRQARFNELNYIEFKILNEIKILLNYSAYGFAYLSQKPIEVGTKVSECNFYVYSTLVGEFECVVRRCQKDPLKEEYSIGLEIVDGELDINKIQGLYDIKTKISSIYEKENRYKTIPIDIVICIQKLAEKLRSFEAIAKHQASFQHENKYLHESSQQITVQHLGEHIYKELSTINVQIQNSFYSLSDSEKKVCLDYYRELIGPFVLQSNFTNRSFSKPLGYAGDYEMMNQLYRNDNFSPTLFGSCVEFAVNLHDEPSAVRNRAQYLSEKIINLVKNGQKVKILAVACGPAQEIKIAVNALTEKELALLEVHLLDQDQQALLYAQQNIKACLFETGKQLNFKLVNKSIKEIIMSGISHDYDLIYSAGLFDYFTDSVAKRACRSIFKALKKDGVLIIGNFNITSPNWFGMLALFDWQLILRSEDDLTRIFKIEKSIFKIEKEPKNVNLFCVIKNGE